MKSFAPTARPALAAALIMLLALPAMAADHKPAASIPAADLLQPAELAASLQSGTSHALVLQVGSRALFDEAHIPGSEYAGPGGQDAGLRLLRERVAALPKTAPLVLYCGCCPWSRCPNVAAAYDLLRALGFTQVKVLYIAENFGANWIEPGFPVTKAG